MQSTVNFIDAIKAVQIPDDQKLVSFDVKSLFTSIPLQLNCSYKQNEVITMLSWEKRDFVKAAVIRAVTAYESAP